MTNTYPQRIGEPECRDFLRTGRCKYGASCKYNHPVGGASAINPNEPPFPIRPGEATCQYYIKNGTCKFGQTCKFHHPPEILLSKGNHVCTMIVGNQQNNSSVFPNKLMQATGLAKSIEPNSSKNHEGGRQRETTTGETILLPQRPGEPDCIYYLRNGKCKYGATCKYHHPPRMNDGKDTIGGVGSRTPRSHHNHVQVSPSHHGRQRSCSDSILDGRELQTYLISGALHQNPSNVQTSGSYMQEAASILHRSLPGSSGHLSTINNSFQRYPPPPGTNDANMANNVNIGGNFLQPLNLNNSVSPKMGSPSMSSTTVASSYDTASLETVQPLPPSRVSGPTMIGSPSQEPMHSRISSYSDLPKLNLSHQQQQVNGNHGQYYHMSRTNSQEDIVYGLPIDSSLHSNNNFPTASRGTIPNSRSTTTRLHQQDLQHQQQQYPPHTLQYSHHATTAMVIQHQSSNKSSLLASQSPPTAEKKSSNDSSGADTMNNTAGIFNQKTNRSVDDGLSMMTDALLSMIDTPQQQQDSSNNDLIPLPAGIGQRADHDVLPQTRVSRRASFSRYLAQKSNISKQSSMPPGEDVIQFQQQQQHGTEWFISSPSASNNKEQLTQFPSVGNFQLEDYPPIGNFQQEITFGGESKMIAPLPTSISTPLQQQQQRGQIAGANHNQRSRVVVPPLSHVDATGRPPSHFFMPSSS